MTKNRDLKLSSPSLAFETRRPSDYLLRAAGSTAGQAYKSLAIERLGIEEGNAVLDLGCGTGGDLGPLLSSIGPTGSVIGVDWRIGLADAWRMVGHDRAVQGNLDPAVLLADRDTVRRRTLEVLAEAGGRPGHIFNLGHGILPQTPVENVLELIATVKGE